MPRRRLIVLLLLGFASGLPLFLTGSTLKAWMTDEGLSLGTIGLFSFVTLPYSLKVFWAPILDRYALPGLGRQIGGELLEEGFLPGFRFGSLFFSCGSQVVFGDIRKVDALFMLLHKRDSPLHIL